MGIFASKPLPIEQLPIYEELTYNPPSEDSPLLSLREPKENQFSEEDKLFTASYTFIISKHEDYESLANCHLNVTNIIIKALYDTQRIDFRNFWRTLENVDTLKVNFLGNKITNIGSLLNQTRQYLITLDIGFPNILRNDEKLLLLLTIFNSMPKLISLRISLESMHWMGTSLDNIPQTSRIQHLEIYGRNHCTATITTLLKITRNIERLRIVLENELDEMDQFRIHQTIQKYNKKIKFLDIIHNLNVNMKLFSA